MLRGINVSGQKKIKMDELRKLYESLGFELVQTYIQSGNVIFKTSLKDTSEIVNKIGEKIKQVFGYPVTIVLRTSDELESIVKRNPYEDKDLSKVHVSFLSENQFEYSEEVLFEAKTGEEEFQILDKEVFLFLPHGSGRTKLTNNFLERKLGVKATTRNWRTINKILDIAQSI